MSEEERVERIRQRRKQNVHRKIRSRAGGSRAGGWSGRADKTFGPPVLSYPGDNKPRTKVILALMLEDGLCLL
ncbi:hypothetical protein Tco_1326945 [Tanacetum coccineum]